MGILALILGILGGLSGIAGILRVVDVLPADIGFATVDWTFWFGLATVLLLGCIASSMANKPDMD